MKKFIVAVSILFVAGSASAAKLYKVVDENGKVTFTQYPPKASTEKTGKVESLAVGGGGATLVTERGGYPVCGKIQLPRNYERGPGSSVRFSQQVSEQQGEWRDRLRYLERAAAERSRQKVGGSTSRNKYQSSYYSSTRSNQRYSENHQDDVERMRDLRCAIQWASSNKNISGELSDKVSTENARLQGILEKLERRIQRECGELVEYDPTDPVVKRKRSDWYQCSDSYRRDMKQVKRKMKSLGL